MNISILLPYKENFSPEYAGAVSIFINAITKKSLFKKILLFTAQLDIKNFLKITLTFL